MILSIKFWIGVVIGLFIGVGLASWWFVGDWQLLIDMAKNIEWRW